MRFIRRLEVPRMSRVVEISFTTRFTFHVLNLRTICCLPLCLFVLLLFTCLFTGIFLLVLGTLYIFTVLSPDPTLC